MGNAKSGRRRAQRSVLTRAEQTGLSAKTLHGWQAEGVDIYDDAAIADRKAAIKGSGHGKPSMLDAKQRKLEAEAQLAELKVEKERRESMPIAQIHDAFTRVGAVVKAAVMRFEADLPPMLAGLSEAQIQRLIRGKVDEVLTALSDEQSAFWKEAQT